MHLAADHLAWAHEPLDECLIHNHDRRRLVAGVVVFGEIAAFHEGNAHQREISGRNHVAVDHHVFTRLWLVTLDLKLFPPTGLKAQRRTVRVSDGNNAGLGFQFFSQPEAELLALFEVVTAGGEIELRQQHVVGIESRVDFLGSAKPADKEPCADQRHQRK